VRVKKNLRPEIPRKTIYRLSIYLRCLQRLRSNGLRTVSSDALAKAAGVKSTQLRKDLTYFGQFGTRGLGYDVEGAGNLGSALLRYQGFQKEGFEVVAAFDANPDSARTRVTSIPVLAESDLETFVREHSIKLAILCVPAEFAQSVVNRLVAAGVQGILNFSPLLLEVPADVTVNNVDLALELEHLSYFIR